MEKEPEMPIVELLEQPPQCLAISRTAWSRMPAELRSETLRMHRELSAGIAKYAPASARDAEMAEWHDLAAASGKRLCDVIGAYIGMEHVIRHDPIKGISLVIQNAGLRPRDWALRVMETSLRAELAELKAG